MQEKLAAIWSKFVWMAAVAVGLLLFGLASPAFSQDAAKICPELELIGPAGVIMAGEQGQFAVIEKKSGKDMEAADIKWTVSAGSIIKGNGTSRVTFMSDKNNAGSSVRISAAIRKYPNKCGAFLTDTFFIAPRIGDFDPDEFGGLRTAELRARIDNFYIQLNYNPQFEGFWAIHFEKQATSSYRRAMIRRVLNIIKFRKYDPSRISFYILEDEDREYSSLWMSSLEWTLTRFKIDKGNLIGAEEISGKLNKLFPGK